MDFLSPEARNRLNTDEGAARLEIAMQGCQVEYLRDLYKSINPTYKEQAEKFFRQHPQRTSELIDQFRNAHDKVKDCKEGFVIASVMSGFFYGVDTPVVPQEVSDKFNTVFNDVVKSIGEGERDGMKIVEKFREEYESA